MTILYSFLSVFSIRLGSIIVGVTNLIESLIILFTCMIWMDRPEDLANWLTEWTQEKDLMFMDNIITSIRRNPSTFLFSCGGANLIYAITCVLLIYGAFTLNLWVLIPFVIFELVRLLLLTGMVVAAMLLVKKNSLDLGLLMGGSIGGGFLLLFLFYMWCCPLSLLQTLFDLRQERRKAEKKARKQALALASDSQGTKLEDVGLSKTTTNKMWNHSVWEADPYTNGVVGAMYIE